MDKDVVIRASALGKKYILGQNKDSGRYRTLRETLGEQFKSSWRHLGVGHRLDRAQSTPADEFWALQDVNFEVSRGEVVGIIGRNGAGKSTLLKVLSRITEPTTGRVSLRGRVASLLEVGTGFHPELTGRENIFLNGAILGMHRREIKAKFDEIVAFAEVERFLDTPVKRYSSGMYVRLAFAVAAHLEPEILIVDEVLAVGDTAFQKKCLGKMQDVAKGQGRTVLFVSHNMGAVAQLCNRCLLMTHGKARGFESVNAGIEAYLNSQEGRITPAMLARNYQHLAGVQLLTGLSQSAATPSTVADIFFGEPLRILIKLQALPLKAPVGVNLSIRNADGRLICLFSTNPHDGVNLPSAREQDVIFEMSFCCLAPNEYFIDVAVTEPAIQIIEEASNLASFTVHAKAVGGHWAYEPRFGDFFPDHHWKLLPAGAPAGIADGLVSTRVIS